MGLKLILVSKRSVIFLSVLFCLLINVESRAALCTSVNSGDWLNGTWSCGTPTCGDSIVILATHTINITTQIDYSFCSSPIHICIYGSLVFTNGNKLRLPCGSTIYVMSGGSVHPGSGGANSNYIEVCNNVTWSAGNGSYYGPGCIGCLPLASPIVTFTSTARTHAIDLDWTTETETDVDYFEVERSENGLDFLTVAAKKSKSLSGHSLSTLNYSATDQNPSSKGNYYRVKEVKRDKASSYSHTIFCEALEDLEEVLLFPNPNNGIFKLWLGKTRHKGLIQVRIADPKGISVYESNLILDPNASETDLNLSGRLTAGVYFCFITVGEGVIQSKLIVQ
jgi:hypothetical protein